MTPAANVQIESRAKSRWRMQPILPIDRWSTKQYSLLSLLAIAHRERIELAPLLDALAQENRGRYRAILTKLSTRLRRNNSLIAALEQTPYALSEHCVLAIRYGMQTGSLHEVFSQLMETERPKRNLATERLRAMTMYWAILTFILIAILTFLSLRVSPSIAKIFQEIDFAEPAPLKRLNHFCNLVWNNIFVVLLAAALLMWVFGSRRSREFLRRNFWPSFPDSFLQSRWIAQHRLMRLLAVGVGAGRPLNALLSTLAKYHYDRAIRHRLLYCRNEVDHGVEPWKSLHSVGLLSEPETALLQHTRSNDDCRWALMQLADHHESRLRDRSLTIVTVLHPIGILFFGAITLWIVFVYMGALTSLIYLHSRG